MEFKTFIEDLIKRLVKSPATQAILLSADALRIYEMAFTCNVQDKVDDCFILHPDNGTYEVYEQIGDAIIKVFMATYFYRRFPKLWKNNNGVKIVARLMIKYGSKEVLASLSELYKFDEYILVKGEVSSQQRLASLLEDVFEAFIGATSIIVDCSHNTIGIGNIVCYEILERIYNQIDISLSYENLFDSKTRLKELVDLFKAKMGDISYSTKKEGGYINVAITWDNKLVIGSASDPLKIKAERLAAEMALEYLKARGFEKKVQKEYTDLI